jgi:hypothetical protein
VTYADTQAIFNGAPIWVNMRIAVDAGIMPLSPVQISSDARDRLLLWLNAGATARTADDVCTLPPSEIEGDDGGLDPNADAATGDCGDADAVGVDGDDTSDTAPDVADAAADSADAGAADGDGADGTDVNAPQSAPDN